MHTRLVGKGLRILAFPCNQFGGQEPWAEAEIKKFVTEKYGVQFDMFSKIKVNGSDADDLYKFLKSRLHGTLTNDIKWNFSKFLIDRQGQPVKRYSPTTAPNRIIFLVILGRINNKLKCILFYLHAPMTSAFHCVKKENKLTMCTYIYRVNTSLHY
ncbi:unnamed protein product [Schistosoma bovis]|nr:unnamed protein product [Schistosoma bovis]